MITKVGDHATRADGLRRRSEDAKITLRAGRTAASLERSQPCYVFFVVIVLFVRFVLISWVV